MSTGTPSKKQNKWEMQIWIFILQSNLLLWDLSLLWGNSGCNYIGTAFVVASGQILPALGLEQTWIEKCRCSRTYHVHITPVNWFYWVLRAPNDLEKLCFACPLVALAAAGFLAQKPSMVPEACGAGAAKVGGLARGSAKRAISLKAWRWSWASFCLKKL